MGELSCFFPVTSELFVWLSFSNKHPIAYWHGAHGDLGLSPSSGLFLNQLPISLPHLAHLYTVLFKWSKWKGLYMIRRLMTQLGTLPLHTLMKCYTPQMFSLKLSKQFDLKSVYNTCILMVWMYTSLWPTSSFISHMHTSANTPVLVPTVSIYCSTDILENVEQNHCQFNLLSHLRMQMTWLAKGPMKCEAILDFEL